MDPLRELREDLETFPITESNSLFYQMAALESATNKLRAFCQTLPKCSNDLNCDTCEVMDKIEEISDWLEVLGDLQQEWDPTIDGIDSKIVKRWLTYYFKLKL